MLGQRGACPGVCSTLCAPPNSRQSQERWCCLPSGKMRPLQAAQWKMHLMASPRGEGFKGKTVLVSRCFVALLSSPHVKYVGDQGWMGC